MSSSQPVTPSSVCDHSGLPEAIVQTAVECVCYGVQMAIVTATWIALGHRQTCSPLSILALSGIAICSTVAVTLLGMHRIHAVQTPTYCLQTTGSASREKVLTLIATRCNYLVDGAIVVWRAWSLCPRSRVAKAALSAGMGLVVGVVVELGLLGLWHRSHSGRVSSGHLLFFKLRTLVWLGPMVLTNLLSATLVGSCVWRYQRNVKGALGSLTKTTSVERALTLLLAVGILYCLMWTAYLVVVVSVTDLSDAVIASGEGSMLETVYRSLAGIYTALIALAAAFRHPVMEELRSTQLSLAMRCVDCASGSRADSSSGREDADEDATVVGPQLAEIIVADDVDDSASSSLDVERVEHSRPPRGKSIRDGQ